MTYMEIPFLLFLIVLLCIFYIVPVKFRWMILLTGSIGFYFVVCRSAFPILIATIIISYLLGLFQNYCREVSLLKRRLVLGFSIILVLAPFFLVKEGNFILSLFDLGSVNFIVPLGVAFYTLQIISYLVDIYRGEFEPEKNIFRYALYISYFPQIVQGPIPRFNQLEEQLKIHHKFNEDMFVKGFQLILWGWFLKLVIADKAAVIVDTVFSSPDIYRGMYVLVAGFLYSIQLYTDFMACVSISRGTSELFGIELTNNFNHPYLSQSISEFWRRWHISLSSWLRDYIYIPLGGNRKGTVRRYTNILIVFAASGMWHGAGIKYIVWGLIHGCYQIVGAVTKPVRVWTCKFFKLKTNDKLLIAFRTVFTFSCVMFAWIIFRAENITEGGEMLLSIFTVHNFWIFFDNSLFSLGLEWKECVILLAAIVLLIGVDFYQEHYGSIREKILKQNIVTRFIIYLSVIIIILVFGTYGFGFEAKDFIYGGF